MRFLIQGTADAPIHAEAEAALESHGHKCHRPADLATADQPAPGPQEVPELLKALANHQLFLMTTNEATVHEIFNKKLNFGEIVVLLVHARTADEQAAAIDRLFERFKRLSLRRLYTVTNGKAKVR